MKVDHLKPRSADEIGDRPVEVAATRERLPHGRDPILETDNPRIPRATMFREQEVSPGLQYPSHLGKGGRGLP
jgi:hypothetical protein